MFRFILAGLVVGALALSPMSAFAGSKMNLSPHTATGSLSADSGGWSQMHNSDGATGGIVLTLPDCAVTGQTSPPYDGTPTGIGDVFVVGATDQAISVAVYDDSNSIINLDGTALAAGDEVDLAVGEVGIFQCTHADHWSAITSGGADGN